MISALHTALTGLTAFMRQVNVAANNVANVNTNGFKRSRTTLIEAAPSGVEAVPQKDNSSGAQVWQETAQGLAPVELSNVDLGEETLSMIVGQRGYEANLKAMQTADEALGSLIDIRK